MATFKDVGAAAKQKMLSAASWMWLNMTDVGQATKAYARGDAEFDIKLRIDDGSYRGKLTAIEDLGWQLVERIDLSPVETETSTSKDDGSTEITRATTQHADFYFVRDESRGE